MKKPLCAAIALALFLCACAVETPPETTTRPSTTAMTPPITAATPIATAREAADAVFITWVNTGTLFYPVSYRVDGVEQLTGRSALFGWYDWLLETLERVQEAPQPEDLTVVDTSAMYIDGAVPALHPQQADMLSLAASNGDWDLFPVKVQYEAYTPDNQPDNPQWTAYFAGLLAEESPQTPIIFQAAWFFDWTGDGTESAVVCASNVIRHGADIAVPNPPPSESAAIYDLSALFVPGGETVTLADSVYWIAHPALVPLDETDVSESYLPPTVALTDPCYCLYSAIQRDVAGAPMLCPFYGCGPGWTHHETSVMVCDIDGDGAAEVLICQASEYAPIYVYKLASGVAREAFRVHTFA